MIEQADFAKVALATTAESDSSNIQSSKSSLINRKLLVFIGRPEFESENKYKCDPNHANKSCISHTFQPGRTGEISVNNEPGIKLDRLFVVGIERFELI